MPAEWEPHAATWLSWPRREGISFPGSFDRVMPNLRALVEALIESEPVCINICNGAHEAEARTCHSPSGKVVAECNHLSHPVRRADHGRGPPGRFSVGQTNAARQQPLILSDGAAA